MYLRLQVLRQRLHGSLIGRRGQTWRSCCCRQHHRGRLPSQQPLQMKPVLRPTRPQVQVPAFKTTIRDMPYSRKSQGTTMGYSPDWASQSPPLLSAVHSELRLQEGA